MIENLNIGKTAFKTSVFKKYFISYSCILFIKFNALRSFCIKLLWISNFGFFHNFDWSNLFLDRSKLRLKFWSASICFDRCLIDVGLVEAFSIDRTLFSINRKLYREFFKNLSFSRVQTLFKLFKTFSLSIRSVKASNYFFVVLLRSFCKVFLSQGR